MSYRSLYLIYRLSIFLVAIYLFGCNKYQKIREELDFAFPDYRKCNVVKLLDGDTFDCQLPNVQIERVKLIGVKIYDLI